MVTVIDLSGAARRTAQSTPVPTDATTITRGGFTVSSRGLAGSNAGGRDYGGGWIGGDEGVSFL